jgi:hypothetical protein
MEEPGPGLTHNHTQIAEPYEALLMIRIFIFLISIDYFISALLISMERGRNRSF